MSEQKILEQDEVLKNDKQRMLVSASAGSGKTHVMIKYIGNSIVKDKISVKDLLVLTFTKAAATEMKERLQRKLKEAQQSDFVVEQLDLLPTANISTIDAFCEKYIKKYANLLNLSENFVILDENLSKKLKMTAFEKALEKFESQDGYLELMFYYKNDKSKIQSIIFEIENLVSSVADKEKFLNMNVAEAEKLFDSAILYLEKEFKRKLSEILNKISALHLDVFEEKLNALMKPVLAAENLYQISSILEDLTLPRAPSKNKIGEQVALQLAALKEQIGDEFDKILSLNLGDKDSLDFQRNATLEKHFIDLFRLYTSVEDELKRKQNALDFGDLERYMGLLSTKENLFANFKYVFIDEYQDTNKVQEKIVKNVAKNCNFVAVGDVKQGIYGFRLASSEIFLNDLKEFEEDENSAVKLLKCNFRSKQCILDFVNEIFAVCMTTKTAGVDYENTSMLDGRGEFAEEEGRSVFVDITKPEEIEKEEKMAVYSVKNAKIFEKNEFKQEILDIKRRIYEVMDTQISDDGVLRKCRFSDIAILSRKRDDLFNEIEAALQECSIPVVSNTRTTLLEEPEIMMLLNYLRLLIDQNDDVSILSVLLSGLYGFDYQQIFDAKQKKSLFEVVFQEKNQIFDQFLKDFEEFRFDCVVVGARKAFVKLFSKTGYLAYINSKSEHEKLNSLVNQFLSEIEKSQFAFDVPALVNYFDSVEITATGEMSSSPDAILLSTIHNSKGLEYPVVFLVGCDRSLSKARPKADVQINEKFGLALKYFDRASNKENISARMLAIKQSEAEKDFVEELMLFYVALTRAKNRLYLFGNFSENIFSKYSVRECDCYFDLVFYALKKEKECLLKNGLYQTDDREFVILDKVEEEDFGTEQSLENVEKDDEVAKKIEEYVNFKYKFNDNLNFRLKESVTALSHKDQEDEFLKFNNENFTFSGNSIEIGNAYHLALKLIDFEKINAPSDLESELEKHKDALDITLIDKNILYNNIQILKPLTAGGKVFKEKEFIMKESLKNLLEANFDDKIMVQGIIDLFVVKDGKAILVDYKFSNSKSDKYLIEKYKNQLKLYKMAITSGLKLEVEKVYLLSLKYSKLIEVEL